MFLTDAYSYSIASWVPILGLQNWTSISVRYHGAYFQVERKIVRVLNAFLKYLWNVVVQNKSIERNNSAWFKLITLQYKGF